ncbi:MAG: alpha/beta fold hydrolase [Actinomycetota bacterium]|nr:alpha/beta fold hydrolase [Actinomycetota bacterium]
MKNVLPSTVVPARLKSARFAGDDYGVTDEPDWRGIDWAAHLHRAEIKGSEVNYVDIGEQGRDRPMLFVHGLSGQWQNWLENIPRFARSRRVVAVDLPGFGCSEMPPERITIELYGQVLAELSDQLDLNPAVVVGNSMGGFVSAELAIRRPDSVERLLLLSAAGVSQMDVAKRPVIAAGKAAGLLVTSSVAQQAWVARRPTLRHVALAVIARHPSRLASDIAYEGLMKGSAKPGFDDALRACLEYDFRDRLPQIGCPTLVLWGEKDAIIPVRDADTFVEMIEGARKIVMEDTGHVPMVERPRTFNQTLEDFLQHDVVEGELEGELAEPRPGPHGGYAQAEPAA